MISSCFPSRRSENFLTKLPEHSIIRARLNGASYHILCTGQGAGTLIRGGADVVPSIVSIAAGYFHSSPSQMKITIAEKTVSFRGHKVRFDTFMLYIAPNTQIDARPYRRIFTKSIGPNNKRASVKAR